MRELERNHPTMTSADALSADFPVLAIVGLGRVGGSIAAAAERAGLVVLTAGRDDAVDVCAQADAVLLCVPDTEIEAAAASLRPAAGRLRLVGHTSGATGLAALAPLAEAGAERFSVHPLQTIPDSATDFAGCPCAISGSSPEAVEFARTLSDRLAMVAFEIDDADRATYHAAAAIASNFLVALEESAAQLLGQITPEARELLAPLVLRTAANWSERGAGALTGPIARGDRATVERHLEALRERAPELIPVYEALAARTREIGEGDS
jgi:predicted short-subunit dehydrogenase-like oxidoreductase (DUF2520 family)